MILERYVQGVIHPTWIALNWGISQGTTEDRVAIVDALQDAAAAAVVADVVDPEVADALSADAAQVLGLAGGMVSEGSLDRVLRPAAPGYAEIPFRWVALFVGAVIAGAFVIGIDYVPVLGPVALLVGLGVAILVLARARGPRPRPEPPDSRSPGSSAS
jgi:hypothetical protein